LPSEREGEPKRPYVVDFEGPDGSGKTTVLRGVAGKLRRAGCRVVTYKTPGPSPTGRFAVSYGNRRRHRSHLEDAALPREHSGGDEDDGK